MYYMQWYDCISLGFVVTLLLYRIYSILFLSPKMYSVHTLVLIYMQLVITTLENPILHISNTFDRPLAVFLLQTLFMYYMFVGVLVCDVISCNSYFIWCLGKDVFP